MLTLQFHNDGTGDLKIGNYNVEVYINALLIYKDRVEGHFRQDGWGSLVQRFVEDIPKNATKTQRV